MAMSATALPNSDPKGLPTRLVSSLQSLQCLTYGSITFFLTGEHQFQRQASLASIPNSQALSGPAYIGSPVNATPLKPKVKYSPNAQLMHQDGGNTGSADYTGPLGINPNTSSVAEGLRVMLWDNKARLTTGYTFLANGSQTYAIAAVDPTTLAIESTWVPPVVNQTLNFEYMELTLDQNLLLLTSKEGRIFVVQRNDTGFTLTRSIDLVAESVVPQGQELLNGMFDTVGNIWFTTGGILGSGDPAQASTVMGYIEPNGRVHVLRVPNQMVENGIGVSGTTMYVVTGPSGTADHANATGYMYALTLGAGTSVTTLWKASYSAGSSRKPGGFARGSGTTPTLLGNQYLAITDNADGQINLIIYHQGTQLSGKQAACSVPLFQPGASATDIGALAHFDGNEYGVVVLNDYNTPPVYFGGGSINGAFNNMSVMAPGATRVTVAGDGSRCEIGWNTDIRIKSVPVLSTKTGLIYGYTQNATLADQGQYVWYAVALNYTSGAVEWEVRTGAGGTYNDDYLPGTLGPDGTFYQGVIDGVVRIKDGIAT